MIVHKSMYTKDVNEIKSIYKKKDKKNKNKARGKC